MSAVLALSSSAARVRAPSGRAPPRSRACVVSKVAAEGSGVDVSCIVSYEETAAGDALYSFHHDDASTEERQLLFSCDGMDVYSDSVDDGDEDAPEILADPVENMELVAVVHADDELEEDAGVEEKETAPPEARPPVFVSYHEEVGCFEVCLDVSRGMSATGISFAPGPDGRPCVVSVDVDGNAHGEVLVGDVLMETSTVEFRGSLQPAWHDTKDSSFTESMAAMRKCADTLTMRMCRDYAPSDAIGVGAETSGGEGGDDGRSWAARMAGASAMR